MHIRRHIRHVSLVILMLSGLCRAAYLEGEGEARDHRPPDEGRVIVPVVPAPGERGDVARFIRRLSVGAPYRHGALTVFPLTVRTPDRAADIVTFDEARRNGWITIRERGRATVDTLEIINHGSRHVLITAGEIIVGGKQNRMVRDDLLVPPRPRAVPFSVYCVEQERWDAGAETPMPAGTLAHPELRKSASRGDSQDAVWREISVRRERARITSATSDYQRLYEDPGLQKRLDTIDRDFVRIMPRHTVGIVATEGARILGADAFSDDRTFRALRATLLKAYALEVFTRHGWDAPEPRRRRPHPAVPGADEIERFLDRATQAREREAHTPGAGRLLRLSGAAEGSALIWEGQVIHLALWP